jgi:hypothetical protein
MQIGEVYSVTVPSDNKDITIKAAVLMINGNKVLFYGNNKLFTMLYGTLEILLNFNNNGDFVISSENLLFNEVIIDNVVIKELDKLLKKC